MAETPLRPDDYTAWAETHRAPRFTVWLQQLTGDTWTRATRHRFAEEVGAGIMERERFARYLVQDYSFIDSFLSLLGFAIGKAPRLDDRLVLGRFAGQVASEENTYFQRSFDALGVPDEDRRAPELLPVTRDFHRVMLEAGAEGDFPEALAVLVVTEWVYLEWAQTVADRTPHDFYFREWIELHASPGFATFVDWLRRRLDEIGPTLDGDPFARTVAAFRETVDLELRFFDAVYE